MEDFTFLEEENYIKNELKLIENKIEELKREKEKILFINDEIEQNCSEIIERIKEMENELNKMNSFVEIELNSEIENAFKEYLKNQEIKFEEISKTYGENVSEKIKENHFVQFVKIMNEKQKVIFFCFFISFFFIKKLY